MAISNAHIITKLQKDLLTLQGFRHSINNAELDKKLGPIKYAFSNNSFPLGAIHEFISLSPREAAVTIGFISSLLAALMQNEGVTIWIGAPKTIFIPAFRSFDVSPGKIIFIDLHKEKEILWAMEEALKCEGLAAVVGQLSELSFTASRRLQLAVEQSRVTGFILRQNPRKQNPVATISRWKITSLASDAYDMPGVGFPRWNIELLKVRNGRPGSWQVECIAGMFRHIQKTITIPVIEKRKAG